MNKEFVDQHPEVVEKLMRGFIRAESFIATNPDEAMVIVAKRIGMEPSALKDLWSEYKVTVELDRGLVDILNNETTWARSTNSTPAEMPDLKTHIYSRGLKAVRPSSVSLP